MNIRIIDWAILLKKYTSVHKLNLGQTVLRLIRNKFRYEMSLEEQFQSGMFLPNLRKRPGDRMVSRVQMMRILNRLNAYPVDMIRDKALFAYYAKAMGVTTPETILVFESSRHSDHCHGRTDKGELLTTESQWLEFLSRNLGDSFIVKAALADGGRDIGLFRRQPDSRYLCKNEYYTLADIYKEIAIKKAFGKCVVQRIVSNHDDIVKMTGSKTLQCLRVLTVKTKAGGIELFSMIYKISGNPTNDTDHFLLGKTGNVYALIDNDTKAITKAFSFDFKRYEFTEMNDHPYTGERLVGWRLPHIDDAINLACQMHRGLSSLQVIGWDLALTPEGPMIIEGNSLWCGSGLERPYFSVDDLKKLMDMIAIDTLQGEHAEDEAA